MPQAGLEAAARAARGEREEPRRGAVAPARAARRRRRPRPRWLRVLRWALARARRRGSGVSVILFVISSLTAQGVPASAVAALDGGGLPPFSATTILVLGSDARPVGSKEPGRRRRRTRAART